MGTHQYHPRVHRWYAYPLDSEEVQVPLPHHVCIAPDSGDDSRNGVHHLCDLPVHERRQLPVHLLPVLVIGQWLLVISQWSIVCSNSMSSREIRGIFRLAQSDILTIFIKI